jgi:GntR family transcriptional regulator
LSVQIDLRSRTPIYEQIISNIKEQAISGALKPDEQIPSIRQLTRELGINPNTIHKAYAELERQGVIYSLAGRGAFVAGVPEMQKLADIKREELLKDIEFSIASARNLKIEKRSIEKIVDKVYTGSNLDII